MILRKLYFLPCEINHKIMLDKTSYTFLGKTFVCQINSLYFYIIMVVGMLK